MQFSQEDRDLLIEMHSMVTDLKHRLYGNGQPGDLDKLRSQAGKLETRVGKLEKIGYSGLGATGLVGVLIKLGVIKWPGY